MKPEDKGSFTPSKAEIESFARRIYPAILEYFESEQGQREFAEWKQKQGKEHKQDSKEHNSQ